MKSAREILSDRGLRCTRQREMIYDALRSSKSHPSAEEIGQLVPGTSTATVYNTLEALHDAGLCRKITTVGGAARYDADPHEHLHIVLESGEISDVPEDLGARLLASVDDAVLREIEATMDVNIRDLRLELRGQRGQRAAPKE